MRTIGQILKNRRQEKSYSLDKLERLTKIKSSFLRSIEREEWSKLPEFPIVAGFVRSYAGVVDANKDHMVAILRRDYPPQKLSLSPKPDVAKNFFWSPKMTSILLAVFVILIISGYLIFQYVNFSRNPSLEIYEPTEGKVITTEMFTVKGRVDPDASVTINNQPALVSDNGEYETEIELAETTSEIVIKAVSRSGKETVLVRKIEVELED